jgi:hypothetical protein
MINFNQLNNLILISGATQLSLPANILYWMENDTEEVNA